MKKRLGESANDAMENGITAKNDVNNMSIRRKRIKPILIEWKKLTTAWGWAYTEEHRIELDPRMDERTLLEVASHEVGHIVLPDVAEDKIDLLGKQIANVLWRIGFRREDV